MPFLKLQASYAMKEFRLYSVILEASFPHETLLIYASLACKCLVPGLRIAKTKDYFKNVYL